MHRKLLFVVSLWIDKENENSGDYNHLRNEMIQQFSWSHLIYVKIESKLLYFCAQKQASCGDSLGASSAWTIIKANWIGSRKELHKKIIMIMHYIHSLLWL